MNFEQLEDELYRAYKAYKNMRPAWMKGPTPKPSHVLMSREYYEDYCKTIDLSGKRNKCNMCSSFCFAARIAVVPEGINPTFVYAVEEEPEF